MIEFKEIPVMGTPRCVELYDTDRAKDKCVGYVLGTCLGDKLFYIWHIYVRPAQRRRGYGKTMVELLKEKFPIVATQVTTNKSKALFKDFKKVKGELVWRSENQEQ